MGAHTQENAISILTAVKGSDHDTNQLYNIEGILQRPKNRMLQFLLCGKSSILFHVLSRGSGKKQQGRDIDVRETEDH